jgi:hypothetical protein
MFKALFEDLGQVLLLVLLFGFFVLVAVFEGGRAVERKIWKEMVPVEMERLCIQCADEAKGVVR